MYQITRSLEKAIIEHAESAAPMESCGLIAVVKGRRRYFPCRNLSTDTDFFWLDTTDYEQVEKKGKVVAIVHSHPDSLPSPTNTDRASCEVSGLPWLIYSPHLKQWGHCEPTGHRLPLVGRSYSYGGLDCFTVVSDYYQDHGVDMLPWKRPPAEKWDIEPREFEDHWHEFGFMPAKGEIQEGDGLLMSVGRLDGLCNHVGVYVGGDRFLHHLQGRLSSIDVYGGYWRDATALVVRHPKWRP